MGQDFKITIHNRYTNQLEEEKVYGDRMVRFAYGNRVGKSLGRLIASRSLSKLYGLSQDMRYSSRKIAKFMDTFQIRREDYEKGSFPDQPIEKSYRNFNEFFIRKFRPGIREFTQDTSKLAAFSEARYFGHENIHNGLKVPVKGAMLNALDLLGDLELAKEFDGGAFLIARLCPVDYHRYHYPDNGSTLKAFQIKGNYHSVNPLALQFRPDIFMKNERRVSILETENFGKLAYIEVGATCVGKIVQSFDESKKFSRGDEKGYFLFGGSTVIVYGQKGRWVPSSDIIKNTELGIETYIHLGDEVGVKSESLS